MKKIKTTRGIIEVSKLKRNPQNPRRISTKKLQQLKKSITDFGDMLQIAPIVVDENYVVLGGNMRLKALKDLKVKETPYVMVENLTEDKKKEFIVKDNITYGQWEWDVLTDSFDVIDLEEFGMDIPQNLYDENLERKVDVDTSKKQLETFLNNDERFIKLFFRPEDQELYADKLNKYIHVGQAEDLGGVVKHLLNEYFTKNNLLKDRR